MLLGSRWAPVVGPLQGLLRSCESRQLYARIGSSRVGRHWRQQSFNSSDPRSQFPGDALTSRSRPRADLTRRPLQASPHTQARCHPMVQGTSPAPALKALCVWSRCHDPLCPSASQSPAHSNFFTSPNPEHANGSTDTRLRGPEAARQYGLLPFPVWSSLQERHLP